MTRKQTPDVLGSLLEEESEAPASKDAKSSKQQSSKTSKQQSGKPPEQQNAKALERFDDILSADEKTRSTLYFASETTYALDEAKLRLRRMLKPENLKSISKSSIAEAALLLALQDLDERGEDSDIARLLAKQ
jgi:hypothetical protein